jgi:hypothetical protein
METCKSGSEGVSVKPEVEIHQGARLLPYKGTWFGSETSYFSDAEQTTTGEEAASNPSRYPYGTWKTRISPNIGYVSGKGDGWGGGYRRMEKAKATR